MADRQPPRPGGPASTDAPLVDLIFPQSRRRQHRRDAPPAALRRRPGHVARRRPAEASQSTNSHRRSSRLRGLADLLRRRTKVVHVASGRTAPPRPDRRPPDRAPTAAAGHRHRRRRGHRRRHRRDAHHQSIQLRRSRRVGPTPSMGSAPPDLPTLPSPRHGSRPRPRRPGPHRWPATRSCTCCGAPRSVPPSSTSWLPARWASMRGWSVSSTRPRSADPFGDQIPTWYPTIGMSTAQIRAALEANRRQGHDRARPRARWPGRCGAAASSTRSWSTSGPTTST